MSLNDVVILYKKSILYPLNNYPVPVYSTCALFQPPQVLRLPLWTSLLLSLVLSPFKLSSQSTKPVRSSTCYISASKLHSPFPVLPTCRNTKVHWSFQPTFWEDPHRVYRKSSYPTFPSLPCQHFCCPPVTSLLSFSTEYPRQVTFHLRH